MPEDIALKDVGRRDHGEGGFTPVIGNTRIQEKLTYYDVAGLAVVDLDRGDRYKEVLVRLLDSVVTRCQPTMQYTGYALLPEMTLRSLRSAWQYPASA